MKQTFSIKKKNDKWLIFDNTEPLDIPFDDGGPEGFTKEDAIQACINLNSVQESEEEERIREARAKEFSLSSLFPPISSLPKEEEETVFDLLAGNALSVASGE